MGATYPHHLTVERPGAGGTTDPDTGSYVPGGVVTAVYDGLADVQDGAYPIEWAADGTPTRHAKARIFLKDLGKITALQIGDTGTVSRGYYGAGRDCEVVEIRLLDEQVFVDWL